MSDGYTKKKKYHYSEDKGNKKQVVTSANKRPGPKRASNKAEQAASNSKSMMSEAGRSGKNRKVEGKKSTITIQGPSTYKSNLKGGALDEFVSPKVAAVKRSVKKTTNAAKSVAKKVKAKGRKYFNNNYKEGA